MTKIKAVIFDFYGLLYPDTSWRFFNDHRELFGDDGEFLLQVNKEVDLGQITRDQYYQRLSEKTGIAVEDILTETMNRSLNQELATLIRSLKKKYKIGLLSNAGPHLLEILEQEGITNLFDALTISYQVGIAKPERQIYFKAVEQLGVAPEQCVFIDDRLENTDAAEKLGMQTVHYQNSKQMDEDLKELLHAGTADGNKII